MLDLLDRARAHFGSDYATSKAIGISRQYLSDVRNGLRPLSIEVATAIADALGEDPIPVVFRALAAQAKDDATRDRWLRAAASLSKAAAVTIAAILTAFTISFGNEKAADLSAASGPHATELAARDLYIMRILSRFVGRLAEKLRGALWQNHTALSPVV